MITTPPDGYTDAARDLDAAEDAAHTIRVCVPHATSAEVVRNLREVREYGGALVGEHIADATAVAIASWWQSSTRSNTHPLEGTA